MSLETNLRLRLDRIEENIKDIKTALKDAGIIIGGRIK